MTDKEFLNIMSEDVAHIIEENIKDIFLRLIDNVPNECSATERDIRIAKNAIVISTQLSCQIMADYLILLGIVEPANLSRHLEQPRLVFVNQNYVPKEDR